MGEAPATPTKAAAAAPVPWRLARIANSDRRVLSRSLITLIGRGISKSAIVIFLILATRLLSKAQYGVYSYVLVLANTFGVLADPQISLVAGRDVSAGRKTPARAYWDAFPVVVAAGFAAALLLLGFGIVDRGPGITPTELVLAGGFVVFNRLVGLGTDMLRCLGRFGLEATIETTGTVVLVAAAAVVASEGWGISAVLAVFVGQALIVTVVCNLALRGDIGAPRRPTPAWRTMLRTGASLWLAASATAAATRAPLIVLGSDASAPVVASYSAALRLPDAVYLLAVTAGQALLPSIAALAERQGRRALRLIRGVALASVLVGTALALAVAPFGHELTGTVFGHQYSSAGHLVSVMIAASPFSAILWVSWFALFAYGGERDVMWIALAGAAVSVMASIAVIERFGASGAAWVYVGVLAFLAVAAYARLEHRAATGGQAGWSPELKPPPLASPVEQA
jgi:O-antigen/teichoic acid export membrane protein